MDVITMKPRLSGWRIALWGSLLALLSLPLIAMQFSAEVRWTAGDFVFGAVLLGALGAGIELAARQSGHWPTKIATALFAFAAFFTLWVNAAVGIIGDEDAINIGFTVMVLICIAAAVFVRLRPKAMAIVLGAAALVPMALGLLAFFTMPGHQVEWIGLTILTGLWALPALLYVAGSRSSAKDS